MLYVKIGGKIYPALSINGKIVDADWDGRASKAVTLEMLYGDAVELFTDGIAWSIVQDMEDDGIIRQEEWDNSDYSVAGDVTDHRDGTITVKMGRQTDLEEAYELLYGGVDA